jgi:transposase
LVNEQGYTPAEAAKSLGIDPGNVRNWLETLGSGPEAGGGSEAGTLRAELRRLRKENAKLLMEREILKKAAAWFAKEQM